MIADNGNLKKILLVEDDRRDVELSLRALEKLHLSDRVVVARDGEEALDYLFFRGEFKNRPGGDPVVVLLDNKMPKIGGLEVLKIIRADEHLQMLPVVVFSSSREKNDLLKFYKHGVNAYVMKPLDFTEFVNAIQQLGTFWATVNEPPPVTPGEADGVRNPGAVPLEKAADRILAPSTASLE
ncbi:MAG: two-component system response regulator [Pedosphaera sp.]|nr:two-component system response regulator [Pedosphaera sp.]